MPYLPVLDNAKFVLMFLVIFGHVIEPLIQDDMAYKITYIFIYMFHMPAFVMMSGVLSKANDSILKLGKSLLWPFIVFNLLYEIFHYFLYGEVSQYITELAPYWIMWFLFSVYLWRLSLPFIMKLKHPIILSFVVAMVSGAIGGTEYEFGLFRTFYFLPFFLIGHIYGLQILEKIDEWAKNKKIVAWRVGLLAIILIAVFLYFDCSYQWFYGSIPYADLTDNLLLGACLRLAFYGLSISLIFILFFIMPKNEMSLFGRGKNSLWIYLWHGFILHMLSAYGFMAYINQYPLGLAFIVFIVISMAITIVLSSDHIANLTNRCLYIKRKG